MHEMGIISGVLSAVIETAEQHNATRVLAVTLDVGEMTEAIEDALRFAFEALSEGTLCEGAEFTVNMVRPRSFCLECYNEFEHDRFHRACPACGSYETMLTSGRELQIQSIEIDTPDDDEEGEGTR